MVTRAYYKTDKYEEARLDADTDIYHKHKKLNPPTNFSDFFFFFSASL